MRTLLIGCGDHGGGTLLPAACSAGISIHALVDSDRERAEHLAKLWLIPQVYASTEDVDADTFDGAIVALPVSAQADHVAWALQAGLHTFVEKPPAPDLDGLRTLLQHAGRAGVHCVVGMNFRLAEGVRRLRSALAAPQYGPISYARVEHIARKPVQSFSPDMSLEASLFAAQGIHAIDLAQVLLPAQRVTSGQMIAVNRGRLATLVAGDPAGGTRLEVHFGSCAAAFSHQVRVVTASGDLLELRNMSELLHLPNGGDEHVREYPGARVLWRTSPIGGGYDSAGYGPELAAFGDLVAGGPAESLASLASLLPVYEAFDELLQAEGLAWTA
ncbi:Gfo/Idh/MocA family protein [Nonomuraea turkmeniaca]|nr:Gfo/Idh/MocA family oxidoreductase [Nonomuraea turkmeniaca]